MTDVQSKFPAPPPPRPNAVEVIVQSASEAFGSAIVVWALGGVAVSLVGKFAGGMMPSLPPGFGAQAPSASHNEHHAISWHTARGGFFILFFAIFFIHSLWLGFNNGPRGRKLRLLSMLRERWFGLIVGNAISAWVAALVLSLIPNFSPWQVFWHWVWEMILPTIQTIGRFFFGASTASTLGDWISWYHGNQSHIYFWVVFIGGAFDDLGVPNFKTFARWSWRRWQKRRPATLPDSANTQNVS